MFVSSATRRSVLALALTLSLPLLAADSGSAVYVLPHPGASGESAAAPHPLAATEGLPLKAVALGSDQAFGLSADGTVWTWTGASASRRLGRLKDIRSISAGPRHALALASDGTVWAWGANDSGQLGDGTQRSRSTPAPVRGLGNIRAIAAGGRHSLALASDGTLWAWGANDHGQLGDGTEIASSVPIPVAGLAPVTALAAGASHSLAMDASGAVWAWGANGRGQLGDGSRSDRCTPVAVQLDASTSGLEAGGDLSLALTTDGHVWSWGDASTVHPEVPPVLPAPVTGLSRIASLAASEQHALAVDGEGALWTWDASATAAPRRVESMPPVASAAAGVKQDLALAACGIVCGGDVPPTGMSGSPVTLKANVYLPPTCTGTPSFDWDFGDGSAHGTEQNPSHVYAAPGTYTWSFVVTNPGAPIPCSDTGTLVICEFACDASASTSGGLAPLPVQFSASATIVGTCDDPVAYAWDFGDGASSNEQNPAHTYTGEGIFTWTLQATSGDLFCSKSGQIRVPCSSLACTATVPSKGAPGKALAFTGGVAPAVCPDTIVPDWDFGDGSAHAHDLTANHAYTSPGTYTWTFSANSGETARCSETGSVTIVNPPVVTSMKKVAPPFKLVVLGSNLQSGIRVFIDGTEWTSVVWKNTGKIQITGGATLKAAVPKGTTKTFLFLNPDGGETSTTFSW